MIGNDIVDLSLANQQSNWQRKGWVQKIFTDREQADIYASKNPRILVWKYWSMKEAVYKAHQRRHTLIPKYNPRDFECTQEETVNIDNLLYTVDSILHPQYIYSIARDGHIECRSQVVESRTQIRSKLQAVISQELGIPTSLISFSKDLNRVPVVCIDKKASAIPVSITHHGQYSAFVVSI
ncbi:4'-phosphopantetheinyl transferase family protein [Aquimarina sediminis]|uniref:4'-phosphopantetheinyl transferase family protein n=1 Tax=Aquimarina sediminis TaxID=2070536 RepID=UPI000CA04A48|nr:4'-phosphopantetheinyl transferase superfamily protein [Aquimarina sediminis]